MKKFYITTTLPYVNADPHIGFALEIIQADAIARFKKQQGYEVCFNFGTDEHGLKIYRKAKEHHQNPQEYCDEYAVKWSKLKEALNLSYTNFIRTTDKHHIEASQEFWKRCLKNGDIYKKNYKSKYCVGCELEKTDSELEDGKCPIHPNLELEIIDEENYFFRFSKFREPLLTLYKENPDFVMPKYRLNEIKKFVEKGLQDFSVSRVKNKMPWGIDVPDDPKHVMYVWFDALINYVSTIGWPNNLNEFNKWWPVTQVAGKDNLRQQSAIWQAMLMSAGLPNSKQIFIHGFITSEGQKISKSLGNVVNPFQLVKKYGTDALRYYLLREIPSYSDGDFSERRFKEIYNADLANGLGNLIARVAKLAEGLTFPPNNSIKFIYKIHTPSGTIKTLYSQLLEKYEFDQALKLLWGNLNVVNKYIESDKPGIRDIDQYVNNQQPWKLGGQKKFEIIRVAVDAIRYIGIKLQPFLPQTAEKILKQFEGPKIKSQPPLFPRIV